VFTGAVHLDADGRARTAAQIRDRISSRVGDEVLPDRHEIFPLFPRRGKDGAVDHEWCRIQYGSGMLYRKCHNALFAELTALRALCQAP
jgi:hypothetical protein